MSSLVDLSHRIVSGQETYPGLPTPTVDTFLSHQDSQQHYTDGTEFHIGRIRMVMNTGTYVDAPFHRYRTGPDISKLDLQSLANLEAVCIHTDDRCLNRDALQSIDVSGKAVLVATGWSRLWGTPAYFSGHPFLSAAAAEYLVDQRVAHVGIDSLNIDSIDDGERPVHSILLQAGIPITEHLTHLDQLPESGFRYFAVPVRVVGAGSFPVRAFALIP
ncbi:MAG: cyclase family protein [Gammaproteobacteria bacterium]|nr:cyclase family protein [Gammaproteobacteria bacterium]MDH3767059.1 cyclase family protein [Gammaproteobacteria bacterium]